MNTFARLVFDLCVGFLNLYPRSFRTEFGNEMRGILRAAIEAAASDGRKRVFQLCLREVIDLPASLIIQYRAAFKKERSLMSAIQEPTPSYGTAPSRQPGTWGASLMAGLPHFLICLLTGIGKMSGMDTYQGVQTASIIAGVGLAIGVIGIILYAWRKRWPIWSASWYFYGTWAAMMIIGLMIEQFHWDEAWRYTNLLLLVWIAFCIIGYAATLLISKIHGLLAVFFILPFFGILNMEFIPDPLEGWLIIGIGLLAFLIAGSTVRIGDWRAAFGLTLAFNLIAGIGLAYVTEYQATDMPAIYISTPSFGQFIVGIILYGLIVAGILGLPFFLQGLWELGRRKIRL